MNAAASGAGTQCPHARHPSADIASDGENPNRLTTAFAASSVFATTTIDRQGCIVTNGFYTEAPCTAAAHAFIFAMSSSDGRDEKNKIARSVNPAGLLMPPI